MYCLIAVCCTPLQVIPMAAESDAGHVDPANAAVRAGDKPTWVVQRLQSLLEVGYKMATGRVMHVAAYCCMLCASC